MSTRTRTTFITALLILTALASVPGVEADHGSSTALKVEIQDLDLETHTDGINGTGAVALINITDPDATTSTIQASVTSQSDTSGETITLHRVQGTTKHMYHGLLGVETSLVAGNGEVFVEDGDTITVTYTDSDTVVWSETDDATVTFNLATYRGDGTTATITVEDADHAGSQINVTVTSTSDPDGIEVTLEEGSAGVFENTTTFTDGVASVEATASLEVSDGDTVTVTVTDSAWNARGHEESPSDTATWERTHSAHVAFLEAGYQTLVNETGAALDGTFYGTGTATSAANANAFIRVEDPDRAGAGTISVVVSSPVGTRTVTLTEQGSDGEFLGFFGFIEAPSSSTGNRLSVADGDTVTVKYDDVRNDAGNDEDVTATATWQATHTGVVRFMTSDTYLTDAGSYEYNTTTSEAGENNRTVFIRLDDEDLLAGGVDPAGSEVTVRVTSTKDPIGVNVTLTDTGPSDSFVGEMRVNSTHSGQGAGGDTPFIWAVADDDIFVTYDDAHTDAGVRGDASDKADIVKGDGTKHAVSSFATGETTPSLKLQSEAGGSAADDLYGEKTFHVELNHYASNNDSSEVELIAAGHVVIGSSSEVLNWTDAGWTGDWTSPTWFDTTTVAHAVTDLQETGADTGIFRGTFSLPGDLAVADGDTVTAAFLANHTHSGSPTPPVKVLVDTAVWHDTEDATVQLRTEAINGTAASTYHGLSMGHVYVSDPDIRADDTTGRDTVTVRVVSSPTDTEGFVLTLTERYARSTGEAAVEYDNDQDGFLGSFTFCDTAGCTSASNKRLEVADGDTVTVRYTDPSNALGAEVIKSDTATWVETTTATISLDKSVYRDPTSGSASVKITVTDADQDSTVPVRIEREDGTALFAAKTLSETTSGVFEGTFDPSTLADEEVFTVYYLDERNANGVEANISASAQFFEETAGQLTFDNDVYATEGASAKITLVDPDHNADPGEPDSFTVWVFSDTDGAGDRVELTETGDNTDTFEGNLGFEASRAANNGKLRVADGDRITAYYFDDDIDGAGTSAAKTAIATWQSTVPVNTAPSATLTADLTDVATDTTVTFTVTASDPEGDSPLEWELDFGDTSAEAEGSFATPPDSTDVTHSYDADGSYTATLVVGDGTDTTTKTVTINVDGTAPADITDLSEVTAEKKSNSLTVEWTAPGDDDDSGTVDNYIVKVSTSAIDDETDFDAADDATETYNPVTLAAADAMQRATITQIGGVALSADTEYTIAIRAVDEVGNEGGFDTVTATTSTPDTTAPTGTLTVSSSTHTSGVASTNNDPTFSWSGISDDESTITYYYVLNSQSTFTVTSGVTGTYSGSTTDTTVSFTNVPAGVWYFHVAGISDGGKKQASPFTLTITGGTDDDDDDDDPVLTAAQIEAANKLIKVSVQREGDENHVSWELPSSPPATVQGVQVWRSNSPYTLLQTFPSTSDEFDDAEYIDSSTGALEDSVYLVTMYYAGEVGLFNAANAPDTDDYDGSSVGDAEDDDFPSWLLWLLIGLGVVILIVVILVVVVVSRKEEEEEDFDDAEYGWTDEEGWDDEEEGLEDEETFAPEEGETHHLMCPNCQTRFTATGTKPLVTNCSGCGKKGILR